MSQFLVVKLSDGELAVLDSLEPSAIPSSATLERSASGNSHRLILDRLAAGALGDRLTELLGCTGFEQDYRPTVAGRAIESLIDKLTPQGD